MTLVYCTATESVRIVKRCVSCGAEFDFPFSTEEMFDPRLWNSCLACKGKYDPRHKFYVENEGEEWKF